MTNPPGNAPTPREKNSASRSFCGQPIVVRVRDLNWQPPAPAVGDGSWVSSLLGEDMPESPRNESLLEGLGETVSELTLASAPEACSADPVETQLLTTRGATSEDKTPSYLHRAAESRGKRRHSGLSGQWLNRLYMGGMAVSLLVASYWVLGGGGGEDSADEVPGDLFAETSDLDEAPPWSGLEPSLTPHEAITVQPLETDVPQMASRPQRSDARVPQNPAEIELPTIQPAYSGLPASPPDGYNPSWSNTTSKPAMEADEYVPSFGPSSSATSLDDDYQAPSYSGGIPTGNNLPNFDANPASRTASTGTSNPAGTSNSAPQFGESQYPRTEAAEESQGHWMFSHGRELVERDPTSGDGSTSASESQQYTQVINGRSDDVTLPQISTPPQVAESTSRSAAPQDPNQYGFGPYSDPYADPYSQQDSAPRSASRTTGLTGDIETFSGTR